MLDMGFEPDIRKIIAMYDPKTPQNITGPLLFFAARWIPRPSGHPHPDACPVSLRESIAARLPSRNAVVSPEHAGVLGTSPC